MGQNLPKSERLNSKKYIQELFSKGAAFNYFPFKIIVLTLSEAQACELAGMTAVEQSPTQVTLQNPPQAQVLFSCSKRNFKKAVDRNAVKRRMREAYRQHKDLLPQDAYFLIAYIYIAREIFPYRFLEGKLKASFLRLASIRKKDTLP